MTKFIGIKIHYDHRKSLPPYLKYSKAPTSEEYQEYLDLYHEEGIGGDGFHECLNFSIHNGNSAKVYLPPTCLPDEKFRNEEMVFFSFTYKADKELPSRIVGVHAAARLKSVGRVAVNRTDIAPIRGTDRFHYHVEAPSEYTTLLTPPLEYDFKDGLYTPSFKNWGYGLRYLTSEHAAKIINAALIGANDLLVLSDGPKALILQREINVLKAIRERYALYSDPAKTSAGNRKHPCPGPGSIPDQELGYLGEKIVYDEEVEYAAKHGIPQSEVQWISQAVPQSPYDIKTVRIIGKAKRDHFIEVKSSRAADESNIYISSRQVKFFKENLNCSSIKLVSFVSTDAPPSVRELNYSQLSTEFELIPIKFKLRRFLKGET